MKILILGYSSLCQRKIIPLFKSKFKNIKFSICSKSRKKENIGAYQWFKNYEVALKKSKADIVYISLINSLHYYWAKKFLKNNYHVIIDKPATLNFKQAKDLISIARKKKKLLSEATVFNYHHQIKKSIQEMNSIKNINYIIARFIIPRLPKRNFHNYKNLGGGCLLDMGPYAASTFRIFFNENIKKVSFINSFTNRKNGLNMDFRTHVFTKNKSFFGHFSHDGEYENSLTLFGKKKVVEINRVFSPPNNKNLKLIISKGNIKKKIAKQR